MNNYQIIIEYDGTKFVGWQFQKNGLSVQEIIQKALKKLLKKKIIIYGSGRTDSGVHALGQSAHFKTKIVIKNINKFLESLNFFLRKHSVSIINIKKKNIKFHARYNAKKRLYKYLILNRVSPTSLYKKRVWHVKKLIDHKIMKKAARLLVGKKDFSAFRAASCGAKSAVKNLDNISINKKKDLIEITFESKSFLQQQVRSMTGCLKYVGEKKWNLKKFKQVIKLKKKENCAPPAPAHGLYLYKVKY
jgi:tRNA pseudouridine38-40 synthase